MEELNRIHGKINNLSRMGVEKGRFVVKNVNCGTIYNFLKVEGFTVEFTEFRYIDGSNVCTYDVQWRAPKVDTFAYRYSLK